MTNAYTRTKIVFLGLLVLSLGAIGGYQMLYVIPAKKCEAAGRWWASEHRYCGVPVRISTLTGRPDPVPMPGTAPTAPPATPAKAPAVRVPPAAKVP